MQTVKTNGKQKIEFTKFNSVLELDSWLAKTPIQKAWEYGCLTDRDVRGRRDFFGVDSMEQAHKFLTEGWQDGLEKFNATGLSAKSNVRVVKNDVVGYAPNVALALMNVPKSMINAPFEKQETHSLSIVYDSSCAWFNESHELIKAGKNLVSVIKELEAKGLRVELNIMNSFCDDNHNSGKIMLCKVKDFTQPLNLKKIMFPMAHSAWFRVVGFEWQDRSFDYYLSGRGKALQYCEKFDKKAIFANLGKNTRYIDFQTASKGVEAIYDYLKDYLK